MVLFRKDTVPKNLKLYLILISEARILALVRNLYFYASVHVKVSTTKTKCYCVIL